MDHGTARFWTLYEVHQPLLVPDLLQGTRCTFTHCRCKIRTTEGAETVLRLRPKIGVARVHRGLECSENEQADQIALVEHVIVSPGAQSATIVEVAWSWVSLQA